MAASTLSEPYKQPAARNANPALPAGPGKRDREQPCDVSFIAGLLVDKFQWHLPLHRQHQRLIQAGFQLSRPWLTQLVSQSAQLLEPIYDAQLDSIRIK